MSWKDKDYEVGYGKPPKSGQFEKGKSGNPDGRPKGTRNFNTDLEEVLSEKVTVLKNGKPKKVSSQAAALMRLREKAHDGVICALVRYLSLAEKLSEDKAATSLEKSLIVEEDEILQQYFDDLGKARSIEIVAEENPEDG